MNKERPSTANLLVMTGFALSCIGLLMWLWMSFGGVMPLSPQGYQVHTYLPEQPLLTKAADIRMAGLDIGNITKLDLDRRRGQYVEMEIDPEFAPIPKDSRIIARQKSLLGQVYIEITPGTRDGPTLGDGDGVPASSQVDSTELDEIVQLFDEETRNNFRGWIREIATAIDNGRGEDLSNAIGNLDDFAAAGSDTLKVLDEQEPALKQLVRNTGVTLNALTSRRGELRDLIGNANTFFEALASRNDALAETIGIFPTFLDESRLTLNRLKVFADDTHPLIKDLIPVAIQLRPTLRDLGTLAPDLKNVFRKLDPIITESKENLPAAQRFLEGAEPLFGALHTYLPQFNPIISFLNYYQETVSSFIHQAAGSLSATMPPLTPNEGPRHYLRQFSISNTRGTSLGQTPATYDRGNAYGAPNYIKRYRAFGMFESFDCANTGVGGDGTRVDAGAGEPPCFIQPPQLWDGKKFPRLVPGNKLVSKPTGNAGTRPAELPSR